MNVLLLFHCASNTGYAIEPLERVFLRAAKNIRGSGGIFLGYQSLESGPPANLVGEFEDLVQVPYRGLSDSDARQFGNWIRERGITSALAFDLPVRADVLAPMRRSGVRAVTSYWGASISSIYPWYMRPIRRAQYLRSRHRPDHFVFESEGMRRRAVYGSCIPLSRTTVCRLGVDTNRFRPDAADTDYVYSQFGIPTDRQVIMFSGHMEPRKGVHVLLEAFAMLVERGRDDLHLLLLGDHRHDYPRFVQHIQLPRVRERVTFGGYRRDLDRLHHGASVAVIPSCGWDSFTMSACEYAASGVPLIVTDLDGLSEAVVHGETGEVVTSGSATSLAAGLDRITSDPSLRLRYSKQTRARALSEFSVERQVAELTETWYRVNAHCGL